MVWRCRVGGVHHLNRPHHRRVLVWSMVPARARKGGDSCFAGRQYHHLLWICGSAVHGAAASACCTDAVLSGASGTCVCERWWALGEPQGRPDLDDIIDALQKWMFDHLRVDLFRPLRLGGSTGMSGHSPRPSDRRQHLSCGVERRSSDVSSRNGSIM